MRTIENVDLWRMCFELEDQLISSYTNNFQTQHPIETRSPSAPLVNNLNAPLSPYLYLSSKFRFDSGVCFPQQHTVLVYNT